MKSITLRTLLFLGLLFSPLLTHAAAPANDKFATATLLRGQNVTLKNQNIATATAEPFDPYIAGVKLTKSAWYRFDAIVSNNTAQLIVKHNGAARFAVFRLADLDGGIGALVFSGGEFNSAASATDTITFTINQGYRYYICGETSSLFDITLHQPGVFNDNFDQAGTLNGDSGLTSSTNENCTNIDDAPASVSNTDLTHGVWFKWTPGFTGSAIIDTNFSFLYGEEIHDTVLYAFTGTTLANLVQVAFDDDDGYSSNSRALFNAVSGTTYYIWVGTFSGRLPGTFRLEWFPASSPGTLSINNHGVSRIAESQGSSFAVQVRRNFAGTPAPSVTFSTSNGTATAGSDYTAVSTVLNFTGSDNAFLINVPVTLAQTTTVEPDETFDVNLTAPTLGLTVPAPISTFVIADDTAPVAPGFTTASLTVKENAGKVYIPLQRNNTQGIAAFTVVDNPLGEDTAVRGKDYNLLTPSGSVSVGESLRFFSIVPVDNGRSEGDLTLNLMVSPSLPGQTVEGPQLLTITITDDDAIYVQPCRIATRLDNPGSGVGASVDVKISAGGALTGKIITVRGTFPFTGKLSATGAYTFRIGPVAGPFRVFTMQLLNSAERTYQLTFTDSEVGNLASALVTGTNFSAIDPCPQAGLYTVADSGSVTNVQQFAAASIKVDIQGNVTATGKIFDGTAFVATGGVGLDGRFAAGVGLYANQGRMVYSGTLPSTIGAVAGVTENFLRPGRANQSVELPPINAYMGVLCLIYTPPVGTRILSVWNPTGAGKATLYGANFMGNVTQAFTVSPTNVVTVTPGGNIPSLKLILVPATGIFTGTVIAPGSAVAKPIFGALLQYSSPVGYGSFLNGSAPYLGLGGSITVGGP